MIMLATRNRSRSVTDSCKRHGGFYLGSMCGPAALLPQEHIMNLEAVDYAELRMEAAYKIEVADFPA